MPGPEDFNSIPDNTTENEVRTSVEGEGSIEEEPVKKEDAILLVEKLGPEDPGSKKVVERYFIECLDRYKKEGRNDAEMEALREKANVYAKAGYYSEAKSIINEVLEMAEREGDKDSVAEAIWILGKIGERIRQKESVALDALKAEIAESIKGPVSYEDVLGVFKKLSSEAGDPSLLDDKKREVLEAQRMFELWDKSEEERTKNDFDAHLRHRFLRTTLHMDAGFLDPIYLRDVLEWLIVENADVPKEGGNESRISLRKDIAKVINKIRSLINSNN